MNNIVNLEGWKLQTFAALIFLSIWNGILMILFYKKLWKGYTLCIIICTLIIGINVIFIEDDWYLSLGFGVWTFVVAFIHAVYCLYLVFMVNKTLYTENSQCCIFLLSEKRNYCTKLTQKRMVDININIES